MTSEHQNLNHFLEVENMYQLYYIRYYQEMTDTTHDMLDLHERFSNLNDQHINISVKR